MFILHPYTLTYATHAHVQESKEDALRIFTEDVDEVKSLPRDKVVDHLEEISPSLVVPYLVSSPLPPLSFLPN